MKQVLFTILVFHATLAFAQPRHRRHPQPTPSPAPATPAENPEPTAEPAVQTAAEAPEVSQATATPSANADLSAQYASLLDRLIQIRMRALAIGERLFRA